MGEDKQPGGTPASSPVTVVPPMTPWFVWPSGNATPMLLARSQTLIEGAVAFVRKQRRAEARKRLALRRASGVGRSAEFCQALKGVSS